MTNLNSPSQDNAEKKETQIDTGQIELPIIYRESRVVTNFFHCPCDTVEQQLKGTDFKLAMANGGTTPVGFGMYDYIDSSIGAYAEVGIAIPVVRKNDPIPRFPMLDIIRDPTKSPIRFYISDIPANSKIAVQAGKEIWGFTKFFTDISFNLEGKQVDVRVADPDDDKLLVRYSGRLGLGFPMPMNSTITLSQIDGRVIETHNKVIGRAGLYFFNHLKLEVGDSQHPMANNLRDMGMDGASPYTTIVATKYQSILGEGTSSP